MGPRGSRPCPARLPKLVLWQLRQRTLQLVVALHQLQLGLVHAEGLAHLELLDTMGRAVSASGRICRSALGLDDRRLAWFANAWRN